MRSLRTKDSLNHNPSLLGSVPLDHLIHQGVASNQRQSSEYLDTRQNQFAANMMNGLARDSQRSAIDEYPIGQSPPTQPSPTTAKIFKNSKTMRRNRTNRLQQKGDGV